MALLAAAYGLTTLLLGTALGRGSAMDDRRSQARGRGRVPELDAKPEARAAGHRALIATLIYAGLRIGEAATLINRAARP
jgi:hypothetical protein